MFCFVLVWSLSFEWSKPNTIGQERRRGWSEILFCEYLVIYGVWKLTLTMMIFVFYGVLGCVRLVTLAVETASENYWRVNLLTYLLVYFKQLYSTYGERFVTWLGGAQ